MFKETLEKVPTTQVGARCHVELWLAKLSASDKEEFQDALASDETSSNIHRAMKSMNYGSSYSSFRRHRNGDCRCPRAQ